MYARVKFLRLKMIRPRLLGRMTAQIVNTCVDECPEEAITLEDE